jgi:hypothetical protein
LVALLFVGLVTGPAAATKGSDDDSARCGASYESAQVLRREEHLEAASTQLVICEKTCPEALAKDCAKWLREVEAVTPTLRLDARDPGGQRLSGVRVTVNGAPLHERADGSVPIEPGVHVLRFEKDGYGPADVRAEVHAGERNHAVAVVLAVLPLAPPAPPPPRPPATASYVLGGIGVAALVGAGVLAVAGEADRSNLRSSCAPTCDPARVDSIRTLWWTAGGVGAAGVIALGLSVALWPRAPRSASAASPAVTIGPRSFALAWRLP